MALPSFMYGDPLKAVQAIERSENKAKGCKTCKYLDGDVYEAFAVLQCNIGKRWSNGCKFWRAE